MCSRTASTSTSVRYTFKTPSQLFVVPSAIGRKESGAVSRVECVAYNLMALANSGSAGSYPEPGGCVHVMTEILSSLLMTIVQEQVASLRLRQLMRIMEARRSWCSLTPQPSGR